MSETCEFVKSSQRPLVGKGRNRKWPKCEKPASYVWTPRGKPDARMNVCKQCGEALAGNFIDELTMVKT